MYAYARTHDRRVFVAVLAALIALAWLALGLWGWSPYGRYLNHEELDAVVHGTANAGAILPVLVAGWTLMTAAMMLPTSLPLIAMFHTLTRRRPDRPRLVGLLIAGYLGVWAAFGLVVHAGDLAIHEVVERNIWLDEHAWLISAATLLLAGVYQFTPLKYHCLDRCRSPLSFITAHWRGRRERLHALQLGLRHGLFCLGCCWSLMLLMFAVGVGSLGWMLALGAVMATEKNLPWGRRLSVPLGSILLAWGTLVALQIQWLPL